MFLYFQYKIERKTGLGPATPTLARLCSTNCAISACSFSRSEEEETRTPTTQLSLPPQSSASTNSATSPTFKYHFEYLCPRQDSNLHVEKHTHLKRARLPIPPLGLKFRNTEVEYFLFERKTGLGPATPTLARLCSTN